VALITITLTTNPVFNINSRENSCESCFLGATVRCCSFSFCPDPGRVIYLICLVQVTDTSFGKLLRNSRETRSMNIAKMLLTLRSTRLNQSYSTVSGYDIDSFLLSRLIRYGSGCFFFPFDFIWVIQEKEHIGVVIMVEFKIAKRKQHDMKGFLFIGRPMATAKSCFLGATVRCCSFSFCPDPGRVIYLI
jgi:hypothetical protein